MNSVKYKKQSGLSLIETMVVLAIAGVLLSYAIPNMRDFFLRQTLNTKSNDMLVDFAYARSEAVNRGQSVKVVASANWKDGWVVSDRNDVVLRKSNSIETNVDYTDSAATESTPIIFKPTGELNSASARTILLENSDLSYKKVLTVSLSGGVSIKD